jgi:hypothetical protein
MAFEPSIAVFDACILYPFHLRNIVVQAAVDRLVDARWTDAITRRIAKGPNGPFAIRLGRIPADPPSSSFPVHPRGPTGTPRASLRLTRGGHSATRGAPLWTPWMNLRRDSRPRTPRVHSAEHTWVHSRERRGHPANVASMRFSSWSRRPSRPTRP